MSPDPRPFDDAQVARQMTRVMSEAKKKSGADEVLDWIDSDPETSEFINYWFAEPQRRDLRQLAHAFDHLSRQPATAKVRDAVNVLRLALSRIIITKDQGISLARDTSHSRPHKVAETSSVSVFPAFERSVHQVRRLLAANPPQGQCRMRLGDARNLPTVQDHSVDAVLTSPPYLNAIDYLRGHRLSLVWLGFQLKTLRGIRSTSIGAERGPVARLDSHVIDDIFDGMVSGGAMSNRHQQMIQRYCQDAYHLMQEVARVLKPRGKAILVVGNSCLKGQFVHNSEGVKLASKAAGLRLLSNVERELPDTNRYLPIRNVSGGALTKRMRTEAVLTFTAA